MKSTTVIQVLEIELQATESLSTLFYRADNTQSIVDTILDELMSSNSSKNQNTMNGSEK